MDGASAGGGGSVMPDSFGEFGFEMMGMMNALKTGDKQLDLILAMMLPFMLRMIFHWFGKFEDIANPQTWISWFFRPAEDDDYERYISHTKVSDSNEHRSADLEEDTHNAILIKAIKLFINQKVKLDLTTAHIDLTDTKNNSSDDDCNSDDGSDDNDDDNNEHDSSLVARLAQYKFIQNLPVEEWYELGEFGLEEAEQQVDGNNDDLKKVTDLKKENETDALLGIKKANKYPVRIRIITKSEEEGQEQNGGGNKQLTKRYHNTTYHLKSPQKEGIDSFLKEAYNWYLGELKQEQAKNKSRYYYEMKLPEFRIGKNNDSDDGTKWKRYKLSDDKTFESLFFQEKQSLLALIDHFNEKSGKYSIKGYPHKLGVLLHGPPGTGKTSLIKALAHYTGRSIVNVPLSRVATNSELMSVFFDRSYNIDGEYWPIRMGFKDVIFVMEDVDAASNVVKRRDGREPNDTVTTESIDLPTPKSLWRLFLESQESDCQELVTKLIEQSARLKEQADIEKPKVLQGIARRLNNHPVLGLVDESIDDPSIARVCEQAFESVEELDSQQSKLDHILGSHAKAILALLESETVVSDAFVEELLGETRMLTAHVSVKENGGGNSTPNSAMQQPYSGGGMGLGMDAIIGMGAMAGGGKDDDSTKATKKGAGGGLFGPNLFLSNPDKLSLSGLLNVLDGVVDTPGRIVVMTTNHPEMLDPALIRPGRVDKKLLLGYMAGADVVSMLELYFQTTLSIDHSSRVIYAVEADGIARNRLNLTPAQVEQLVAEFDELEDMIFELEARSPASKPKPWSCLVRNISSSRSEKKL